MAKKDKICYKLYQLMHYLHVNDLFHSDWVKTVHETLDELELSDIWLTHNTFYSQVSFKNKVKTRLSDQFKQEWNNNVNETEKCLNYRIYKRDLSFERYLNILPFPLAKTCLNSDASAINYQLKRGVFLNIERNERICSLCNKNELGDEFHYLFYCEFFFKKQS